MKEIKPMKCGIIGCGRMGRVRASAIKKLGSQILAVYDPDLLRASELALLEQDCHVVNDLDKLPWYNLDAIFICSPPSQHLEQIARAISWNIPFFLEKPASTNAADLVPFTKDVKTKRLINAVGYMNRYRDNIQQLRGRDFLAISGYWVNKMYQVPWWGKVDESGGPINEQCTHLIDLNRYLMGEVQAVHAFQNTEKHQFPTTVTISLNFESGVTGSIIYSCEANAKIIGLDLFTPSEKISLRGWDFLDDKDIQQDQQEIFNIETASFLRAISSGKREFIKSDLRDALETQFVVDAIYRSLQSLETVNMSSFISETLVEI